MGYGFFVKKLRYLWILDTYSECGLPILSDLREFNRLMPFGQTIDTVFSSYLVTEISYDLMTNLYLRDFKS